MKNLNWAISVMKKCYVAPNTIDSKILNDSFAFSIAMTQITNAVLAGDVTSEQITAEIMGESK